MTFSGSRKLLPEGRNGNFFLLPLRRAKMVYGFGVAPPLFPKGRKRPRGACSLLILFFFEFVSCLRKFLLAVFPRPRSAALVHLYQPLSTHWLFPRSARIPVFSFFMSGISVSDCMISASYSSFQIKQAPEKFKNFSLSAELNVCVIGPDE